MGILPARVLLFCLVAAGAGPVAATAHPDGDEGQEGSEPASRQEILRRAREAKQAELEPYTISTAEARVRFFETWRLPRRLFAKGFSGFRPVVGGMSAGSGLVGGGGYISGYSSDLLQFTANARYSTRGYQAYDAGVVVFPRANSLLPVEARFTARSHDFTSLRYFGLGGDSSGGDRSTYRLEDRALAAGLAAWAGDIVELDAELQWLTARTSPGSSGASLDTRFNPAATPGFGATTDYLVYGGRAAIHLRDESVAPSVGVTLAGAAHRYDDRDLDTFDFTRMVGEVTAHVPLGYRNRILALRLRTSHAVGDDGGIVPFYLMETLGGANSIRGFREYRFRDTRNLVLNVEYRWEVWTYADFAFFYDAGKVFSAADALSFDGMKSGYGFGIRGHGPGGAVLRFDFAKSNEGFILHVGSGPSF